MVHEHAPHGTFIDDRPMEVPEKLTMEWTLEHTNMEVALRAYEAGVHEFGPSTADTASTEGEEAVRMVGQKVPIQYEHPAVFSLQPHEIHGALCLLPRSWLEHARLEKIKVLPTQYFAFGDLARRSPRFAGENWVCRIISAKDAEDSFAGRDAPLLREHHLIGPPTRFHYAPGMYVEETATIYLWEEPPDAKARISPEARREYGRELVVHEALHSVLGENVPVEFCVDGQWREYWDLLGEFHRICQEEPVAVTRYSELYAPWLRLPLDADSEEEGTNKRFRVKTALQEELGELLSAYVRGWGATPEGTAVRPADRDFGGTALHDSGVSRKVAFVSGLLRAPVRAKTAAPATISALQQSTAEKTAAVERPAQ